MSKKLFVWTRTLRSDGSPILLGRLQISRQIGQFEYDNNYRLRAEAFALDPINLPLQATPFLIDANHGIPGPLADAGPEAWGRPIMENLLGITNLTDILLRNNGLGAGSLVFSQPPDAQPKPATLPTAETLGSVDSAMQKYQTGRRSELTKQEQAYLTDGCSMGGGRPKLTLSYQGRPVIIKWPLPEDPLNFARVENATLSLARKAGIAVAESAVETVGDKDLFIVRRFDRTTSPNGSPFVHYLSVASLLTDQRLKESNVLAAYSYPGTAAFIAEVSDDAKAQRQQLFRRMVFNVLMNNTDDHARNHGFIMHAPDRYVLSPAFDIVPQPEPGEQSMGVGIEGRRGTLTNCLTRHPTFDLTITEAQSIIDEVRAVTERWAEHFHAAGVSAEDIHTLAPLLKQRQGD